MAKQLISDSTDDRRRRFLSVRQVAEFWGVSDDKVRADIRRGVLEAYTINGCIRVHYSDVLAYGKPFEATV